MPKQKDLKRIVRSRMRKTGESYTSARAHVIHVQPQPPQPEPDYDALAKMSGEKLQNATGRSWPEWVALLDAFDGTKKSHRESAVYVASLGTPDWWTQTVVVGYERIRGLRAVGQRREGFWEASKSRTYAVPVSTLFAAFKDAKKRARWLPGVKVTIRTAMEDRSMRIGLADGTLVAVGFMAKGEGKSAVAVQHTKLPSKAEADRLKAFWGERRDALKDVL